MMNTLWTLIVLFSSGYVEAQLGDSTALKLGLHAGYSYMHYKEPGAMSERGFLTSIKMELSGPLVDSVSVFAAGRYSVGYLNYNGAVLGTGTPVTTLTRDWVLDTRLGFTFGPPDTNIFIGYGKRDWLNDMRISYRRETWYEYIPVRAQYGAEGTFIALEYRNWLGGKNVSWLTDVDVTKNDVTMKQNKGTGYSAELGYAFSASAVQTRISIAYEHWDIDASELGYDGTQYVVEPKNSTDLTTISIGVVF